MTGVFAPDRRATAEELMDAPDCCPRQLRRTLEQFIWINRLVSRFPAALAPVLNDMRREPGRTYHLLDVGAGCCDIPAWLLKKSARRGLKLRVTAVDRDPRTVAHARQRFGDVSGLDIIRGDIFDLPGVEPLDYVFANHFLHHLDDDDAVRFLRLANTAARRGVVVSDLARSRWSYAGFSLFAGLLFRDSFAYADGKLSILKGFRFDELKRLAAQALPDALFSVRRAVPGRLILRTGRLA